MKTMKKSTQLQLTLDGLSTVLDIFPDSDLSAELDRVWLLSQRTREFTNLYRTGEVLAQAQLLQKHLKSYLDATEDVRALSGDWQRVGGDLFNAYHKVRAVEKKRVREDDANSWSY